MKKYSLYLTLLALSALLVILAACGQGDIVDLSDKNSAEFRDIEGVVGDLTDPAGFIDFCGREENKRKPECGSLYSSWEDDPTPISSSPSPSSSSDDGNSEPSSSSYVRMSFSDDPSSSSLGGGTSQGTTPSSASTNRSSSIDPNAYEVPAFTCDWSKNPVTSGADEIEPKINFTDPAGASCTKKAWAPISNLTGMRTGDVYEFTGKKVTPKFGEVIVPPSSNMRQPLAWPAMPTGEEAKFDSLFATVTCSGDGKAPGSREVLCKSLTITKAPKAGFTGKVTLIGAHSYSSSSVYYIGETPNYESGVSITSNQADCGTVDFDKTLIGGALATGDAGKQVKVVAICEKSGQRLDSAVASVVPNPVLGACTWKDNKTILAKGQEATPSATISDSYGRCGAVSFSNGFPKVLTESDVGSIEVTASTNCGELAGTLTKVCPTLEVKSAIYELKSTEDRVTIPNEATVIEMDLPSSWKPSGTATFFCQVTRDGGNGSASGKIGTGTSAVSISGNDYVNVQIPLEWTKGKYSLQVDIKCGNSCTCGVGW